MTSRQTKLVPSKVAPSPAQPSKVVTSSLAPPPSSATIESHPLPIQASSEMLTVKDLQAALSTMTLNLTEDLERRFEKRFDKMEKKLESKIEDLENKIENQGKGVSDELEKIKATIQTHNMEIREDIVEAVKGVWEGVEEKVEEVEQQMKSELYDHALMVQYNQMMSAIRIRGLREVSNETQDDLRRIFEEALEKILNDAVKNFSWQIDRIYRINSRIARQRNLPRDVVIYFVTRRFRNHVLTISYNKILNVAGQEVVVLKEIPPKMLRARKEYAFLVAELKIRALQYRWEVPAGLSLSYQGKRYYLNSVAKAKDFAENVLKAGRPPSSIPKNADLSKEEGMELLQLQFSDSQPPPSSWRSFDGVARTEY